VPEVEPTLNTLPVPAAISPVALMLATLEPLELDTFKVLAPAFAISSVKDDALFCRLVVALESLMIPDAEPNVRSLVAPTDVIVTPASFSAGPVTVMTPVPFWVWISKI
jgi:hypothetical protein